MIKFILSLALVAAGENSGSKVIEVMTVEGAKVSVKESELLASYFNANGSPDDYAESVQLLNKGSILLKGPGFKDDKGQLHKIYLGYYTRYDGMNNMMVEPRAVAASICELIGKHQLLDHQIEFDLSEPRHTAYVNRLSTNELYVQKFEVGDPVTTIVFKSIVCR